MKKHYVFTVEATEYWDVAVEADDQSEAEDLMEAWFDSDNNGNWPFEVGDHGGPHWDWNRKSTRCSDEELDGVDFFVGKETS